MEQIESFSWVEILPNVIEVVYEPSEIKRLHRIRHYSRLILRFQWSYSGDYP